MSGSILCRAVVSYRTMPRRSTKLPTTAAPDPRRFQADDIVRAIETVQQAGLTIRGVEITTSGSIKIETEPAKANGNAELKQQPPPAKTSD